MIILHQNIYQDDERQDGSILIQMNGFVYNIGTLDGEEHWIERQSIEDYNNDLDGFEHAEWYPAKDKRVNFKFLNKK